MGRKTRFQVTLPGSMAGLQLPEAVNKRLHALLDKQDAGQSLTPAERSEAKGLAELADTLSLLRLRSENLSRRS